MIAQDEGVASRSRVVEVGLLLPADHMTELLALARARKQSIAQVLRAMIERELETWRDECEEAEFLNI